MREEAFVFGAAGSLVGVITDPALPQQSSELPAIILLNSGIVHRVGLNRLHVKLARILAPMGFVGMRFDFSGIGDSPARQNNVPFQKSAIGETQEAMNHLGLTRGFDRFILMGICSGAGIALQTACIDPRVVGVVSINCRGYLDGANVGFNAQIRNRALLRHYRRIAFSSSFRVKNWLKAITGKVNYRSIIGALGRQLQNFFPVRNSQTAAGIEHPFKSDLRSLIHRRVAMLFIHAEGDEGLDYVQMILGADAERWQDSKNFRLEIIQGANHTFALLWSQEKLLQIVCAWVRGICGTSSSSRLDA